MPQSWEDSKDSLGKALWPLPKDDSKGQARKRDKSLHSIGNLTLLHHGVNRDLVKNLPFLDKKRIYGKYATLKITDEIREHNEWDVEQIDDRAEKMYKRFCEIWPSAEECLR